jgi:hypothetical protein
VRKSDGARSSVASSVLTGLSEEPEESDAAHVQLVVDKTAATRATYDPTTVKDTEMLRRRARRDADRSRNATSCPRLCQHSNDRRARLAH